MSGSVRRLEARPGPAAAHGPAVRPCQPGGRLSETGVAIARACLRRVETVIAFAGAKWVFLSAVFGCSGDVGFSGALLGVSSGVVGFNVATLSHLVREKVRPARSKQPKIGVFTFAGRVFSRQPHLRRSWMQRRALQAGCRWGFCSIRNWLSACRRRVTPLMTPFPPLRGAEVAA